MTDEEVNKLALTIDTGAFCNCPLKGKADCKRHKVVADLIRSVASRVRADALKDAAEAVCAWCQDGYELVHYGGVPTHRIPSGLVPEGWVKRMCGGAAVRALSQGVDENGGA